MSRIISLSEVKQHKNSESCWVVIHNDVYDVTSYLSEHPGGEDALLDVAGKDGTQNFEDVGHSDDAREIMKKFKIGSLPPGEGTAIDNSRPLFQGATTTVYSCEHIPKIEKPEKTWRTYDGSPASTPKPDIQPIFKTPSSPKIERRVQSIIVPKERYCEMALNYSNISTKYSVEEGTETEPVSMSRLNKAKKSSRLRSTLKWAVLALAGAVVIGFVIKKYMAGA